MTDAELEAAFRKAEPDGYVKRIELGAGMQAVGFCVGRGNDQKHVLFPAGSVTLADAASAGRAFRRQREAADG